MKFKFGREQAENCLEAASLLNLFAESQGNVKIGQKAKAIQVSKKLKILAGHLSDVATSVESELEKLNKSE